MELTDIIKSVDIVEYVSQFVELEEKNGEYWGISPFTYPPEKTPSFSIRPESGKFFCFSSGIGGSVLTFIQYYNHVSKGRAVQILKKYANIDDSAAGFDAYKKKPACISVFSKYKSKQEHRKAESAVVLPQNYMDRFEDRPEKLQIWRDEGITDEAMRYFGVKYDAFSDRIVYPIKNINGEIVNVGGRTLDPDFKRKKLRKYTYFHGWGGQMAVVYGIFENKEEILRQNQVILFEGMKSVLLARGYGYENCGAILTSHLNPGQMRVLARLGVPVVFALDKEVKIPADHNIQKLKQYVNVSYLFDFSGQLGEKDAPVDKGKEVFDNLFNRFRYKL